MSNYAPGIDISQYQSPDAIDWNALYNGGYKYAFVRSTQGSATSKPVGKDTAFVAHVNNMLASHAPIHLGVYHAFLPAVDGVTQARFMWQTVKEYKPILAFPLVIDVEITNDRDANTIASRLLTMCTELSELSGALPMIYTSIGFWNSHVGNRFDNYFTNLKLWVAHYTTRKTPLLPRCWSDWHIWQYTSKGKVPGYAKNIDVNRMKS